MRLERCDDGPRWAAAAAASGQPVTPFHDLGWLRLAARLTGSRLTPLVVTAGGADVGVAPLLAHVRGPLVTVNWVPFPYAGPLVPPDLLDPVLRRLARSSPRPVTVVRWQGLAPTTALPPGAGAGTGWDARWERTWVVDTSRTEEEAWRALAHSARKSINKCRRDGVVVQAARDGSTLRDAVEAAYAARGQTSGYGDLRRLSPADLERLDVGVRWTVAVQDGVELASLLSLATGDVAFTWLGGILPQHRATRANVLLYWDALLWARERGVALTDLVGIPDAGIGRFKSQFGGTERAYPVFVRTAPGWQHVERLRHRVQHRRDGAAPDQPPHQPSDQPPDQHRPPEPSPRAA